MDWGETNLATVRPAHTPGLRPVRVRSSVTVSHYHTIQAPLLLPPTGPELRLGRREPEFLPATVYPHWVIRVTGYIMPFPARPDLLYSHRIFRRKYTTWLVRGEQHTGYCNAIHPINLLIGRSWEDATGQVPSLPGLAYPARGLIQQVASLVLVMPWTMLSIISTHEPTLRQDGTAARCPWPPPARSGPWRAVRQTRA